MKVSSLFDRDGNEDPRLFPKYKKVIIVFFVILAGAIAGLSSTIYFPGIPDIINDLHASPNGITASLSLYILVSGIAPIAWCSLSDNFQIRKIPYIVSLVVFALASLGACFVADIWALVVLRCAQAVGASCSSLGAGTIADLYPMEQRGTAMGFLFFGMFIGPLVGPNIGGVLTYYWSWRATFWFCFVYAGVTCIGMLLFTVETYRPPSFPHSPPVAPSSPLSSPPLPDLSLSDGSTPMEEVDIGESTKADNILDNSSDNAILVDGKADNEDKIDDKELITTTQPTKPSSPPIFNPAQALLLLRHPFVLLTSLSMGVAFGVMFTFETVLPELFEANYHLNSWQIGLCYLGGGSGNVISSFLGGRYIDRVLAKRKTERGHAIPEDRFPFTIFASGFVIQPLGSLLFAWGIAKRLPVGVPIFGFALVCFGMTQILLSGSTYLVDATGKGASATAAANCVRNVFAFVLSFLASPMKKDVGYIGVLAACLSVSVTVSLYMNKLKGEQWRKKAGFSQAH